MKRIKPKLGFVFKIFLLGSFIFLAYQLIMLIEISKDAPNIPKRPPLIRGSHEKQYRFYEPNPQHMFKCFQSYEYINYSKINDDYCDCLDGTDEPGTNACSNGIFYCEHQSFSKNVQNSVPSYKVNDGICDCCDGSDEWTGNQLITSYSKLQGRYKSIHPPCPNVCR